MDSQHLSPRFKKWIKKCLNDEFSSAIEENLKTGEREPYDVAQKIINSREMTEFANAIRTSFVERLATSRATTRQNSAANSRPQTSLSHLSELSILDDEDDEDDREEDDDEDAAGEEDDPEEEDWSAKASGADEIGRLVEQMGQDKPDHVRLAGYEALLKAEVAAGLPGSDCWPALLKALRDGLVDGGRSVFEASLLLHAKLLGFSHSRDAYANLLEAFSELCRSRRLTDSLPTLLSGVNFKLLAHEKLFRLMRLLLDQHEELLKTNRSGERLADETIERFVGFLSFAPLSTSALATTGGTATVGPAPAKRPLGSLQILSVLDPQANWARKWNHGLASRRSLCSAMAKSPSLLRQVVNWASRGLENPAAAASAAGLSVCARDDEVFVSGDSVETLGFLHCLSLLTQLCASATGRELLAESLRPPPDSGPATAGSFSLPDFLAALLGYLNALAGSDASNWLYERVRAALGGLLERGPVLYDARFYQLALAPLRRSELRLWPHTIDVLGHMLDCPDGASFLASDCGRPGSSLLPLPSTAPAPPTPALPLAEGPGRPSCPLVVVLGYAANLLRQPVAVVSVEHATELFRLIGKVFRAHELFHVLEHVARQKLYPSLAYMYSKLDKYYIENENKTQHLDKSVKEMLLSLVAIPLGLQMLAGEPLIFDELIRGSIAPVRASWSAYDVVGFVANAGFLARGVEVLTELAPHVLSTLLVELCKGLEDPRQFFDPWESTDVQVFLHVLALFSLNTRCFLAFMTKEDEENQERENEYIINLYDLFQRFTNVDSPYHHLGLLALKVLIWNLDIYIYSVNLLDFQNKLVEFQSHLAYVNENKLEPSASYIVDESSLLRHALLLNAYFVRPRRAPDTREPEEYRLFAELPPPDEALDEDLAQPVSRPGSGSGGELELWLGDSGPGLRDTSWVLGTRRAHKASPAPMPSSVLLNLLEQMEKAIPTVEWVDSFKWDPELQCSDDYWLPEEIHGIDLVIHYSTINDILENAEEAKNDLKVFIQASHHFINYSKPTKFEGFDWFLAAVFLICDGNIDKAKTFLTQILHFSSTTFIWPALAKVIDDNNKEEASTRLLFAHLLETIISYEFPAVKFALKRECGIDWWMISDRLLSQCFIGILPWSEIMHFFAICILYSPDYVLYYCASLLNHCESDVIKTITKGQMWPENLILEDYRCHSQIGFMDRLGKRYGGKFLPSLTQGKLNFSDNPNSTI